MAKSTMVVLLMLVLGCGVDPEISVESCRGNGVDHCAELLGACVDEADPFERRTCRAIVADDDWCACRDATSAYGSELQ